MSVKRPRAATALAPAGGRCPAEPEARREGDAGTGPTSMPMVTRRGPPGVALAWRFGLRRGGAPGFGEPMRAVDVIRKKRDRRELSADEIGAFARAAADGSWPDYQLSALLMAIYLNGMTPGEAALLTGAMT